MKIFVDWIFALFGWRIEVSVPKDIKKAVVVVAPHTSNWDFVIGRLAFYKVNFKARFLIKKELFVFPLNFILRILGALPVNRGRNNNMVQQAVKLFNDNDAVLLIFTPEGTRAANQNWRKGFYVIAQTAKVPILLAYMDYRRKIGGIHGVFQPTGNVQEDIISIKRELAQYEGKYPENGIIL